LLGLLAFALARVTEAAFPKRVIAARSLLIAGWFAVLVGVLMAVNTTWFQSSIFSGEASRWRNVIVGLYPIQVVGAALSMLILCLAVRAARGFKHRSWAATGVATTVVLALVVWAVRPGSLNAAVPASPESRPHIVILGIDSLRNDLKIPRRGKASTPNFAAFLDEARRFNDAITPLPRT
jgi:hypothetical protein